MNENKNISKILNHAFVREMCHERHMKISKEAINEIALQSFNIVIRAIEDTKEVGGKLILKRHVEQVI